MTKIAGLIKQIRVCLVILFSYAFIYGAWSQTGVDSLEQTLKNEHSLEKRINILIQLSKSQYNLDIKKSEIYAKQALQLAESIQNNNFLGDIYYLFGRLESKKENIEESSINFIKAAEYYSKSKNDSALVHTYLELGNCGIEKTNFAEALNYYLKAEEISIRINYPNLLANLYNNMGVINLRLGEYQKALSLYTQALDIYVEKKDTLNIAGTTTNIGTVYIELGDLESAESFYERGFELFRTIDMTEGIAHSLLKLGLLNQLLQHYDSSLLYLNKSLEYQKKIDVNIAGSKSIFWSETLINIGIAYFSKEQYDSALNYIYDGYNIALNTSELTLLALSADYLYRIYKIQNKTSLALSFHEEHKKYSDSVYNEKNVREVTQLKIQHEFNKKQRVAEVERELEEQKHKRKSLFYMLISGGLFSLLIISFLALRLERNKKKKIEIEKISLNKDLNFRNKELATHVLNNVKRSEMLLNLSKKLREIDVAKQPKNAKIIQNIINEMRANTSEMDWKEFEIRFQNVYTGFYHKLTKQFPDLTPNELRLCAFLRLNMSTKDISAITYQSTKSIDMARFRLRKKLKMVTDDNLITFLAKY